VRFDKFAMATELQKNNLSNYRQCKPLFLNRFSKSLLCGELNYKCLFPMFLMNFDQVSVAEHTVTKTVRKCLLNPRQFTRNTK
jgi:hypothetical protein